MRFILLLEIDFPINDGALFVQMSEELLENNFRLPIFTGYNNSQIPFSYPPLAFYLIALLIKLTGFSAINIIQFLPATISTISVFIFYIFSFLFFRNRLLSFYATLSFAIIPQNYLWLIMGGGVTRALGQLFSLIVLINVWNLLEQGKRKNIFWFAISMSLLLLSHPDTALATIAGIAILFLFYGRNKKSFSSLIKTILLTIVMTSIWWIPQYINHQFEPIFAAMKTGLYSVSFWLSIIGFDFTLELGFPVFAVMGFLGILYLLIRKEYFLIIWFLFMFAVQPRSGARNSMLPFSLMVAYGIDKIFLPSLSILEKEVKTINSRLSIEIQLIAKYLGGKITRLAFSFIIFYGIFSSMSTLYQYLPPTLVLSDSNKTAMKWIDDNLDEDSIFLVLPITSIWERNYVSEWFPYISDRKSIVTVQGSEWLPDNEFSELIDINQELIICIYQGIECLESWDMDNKKDYSYIYLNLKYLVTEEEAIYVEFPLSLALKSSDRYSEIYREEEVVIFKYSP